MTTARLARPVETQQVKDPSNFASFFLADDRDKIGEITAKRECSEPRQFPPPCKTNLFFGLFFDGTNNNLRRDRQTHAQSNVARLYEAFPGGKDDHDSEAWKDLATYRPFFRTYIPGVGTPFDQVDDSGTGF